MSKSCFNYLSTEDINNIINTEDFNKLILSTHKLKRMNVLNTRLVYRKEELDKVDIHPTKIYVKSIPAKHVDVPEEFWGLLSNYQESDKPYKEYLRLKNYGHSVSFLDLSNYSITSEMKVNLISEQESRDTLYEMKNIDIVKDKDVVKYINDIGKILDIKATKIHGYKDSYYIILEYLPKTKSMVYIGNKTIKENLKHKHVYICNSKGLQKIKGIFNVDLIHTTL